MWYRVLICVGGGLDIFDVCDICRSLELGSRRLCTQAAAEAYITMQGEYYSAGGVLDGACVILEEDGIFR
jgi:hypothetical protein